LHPMQAAAEDLRLAQDPDGVEPYQPHRGALGGHRQPPD
jgi:hypothetical protein